MCNNKEEAVKVCAPIIMPYGLSTNNFSGKIGKSYLTKFSNPEVLVLQRLVQQECQNGLISEKMLVKVYADMFPMGNVSKYVKIVFNMINYENTGYINCGEFLEFISVIARGSTTERALSCFQLFDVGKKGVLCRKNVEQVGHYVKNQAQV